MSLFYSGWAIFITINLNNDISYNLGLFMGRLGNGFAVFIPVTWYHFAITYAGSSHPKRHLLKTLYTISILIACFSFSSWFIPEVKPMVDFKYYPQAGPIYWFFAGLFFTVVPLSFFELYKKMKISSGYEQQQLKGLFVASLIGYIGGSPTFLPSFGIPFPQYTLILIPFYPFMLAYFMIKQKLFDIEELAQAAHRDKLTAIGVLAASINHEVKNPLFIIKGLAENCLERQKEGIFPSEKKALESVNDAMKRSVEQADRAMDIIKRLSLFAKAGIDSEIKFESIKIVQVIEDILPLVRYELAAHGIALSRDMPPDLPDVRADRRYLEEILFNLIVNACQAIKEVGKPGEIVITASSKPSVIPAETGIQKLDSRLKYSEMTQYEKGQVLITIQDNGPGIPAEKLKNVFHPFYTTKAEGTSLGLYITQQLVEKIHGRIDVQSAVGIGTTFTVHLPVYP